MSVTCAHIPIAVLDSQSDARLLELAREGEVGAFEALVRRYQSALRRHCARTLPASLAEDATQQAFLALWTALEDGGEIRNVRPWLYRVARNAGLSIVHRSGYRHEKLPESLDRDDNPLSILEREVKFRATLDGIAALPARQRQALVMMALEDHSAADVAGALGTTDWGAIQLVRRARSTLRAAVPAITPLPLLGWLARRTQSPWNWVRDPEAAPAGLAAGAGAGAGVIAKSAGVILAAGLLAAAPLVVRHAPPAPHVAHTAPVALHRAREGAPANALLLGPKLPSSPLSVPLAPVPMPSANPAQAPTPPTPGQTGAPLTNVPAPAAPPPPTSAVEGAPVRETPPAEEGPPAAEATPPGPSTPSAEAPGAPGPEAKASSVPQSEPPATGAGSEGTSPGGESTSAAPPAEPPAGGTGGEGSSSTTSGEAPAGTGESTGTSPGGEPTGAGGEPAAEPHSEAPPSGSEAPTPGGEPPGTTPAGELPGGETPTVG
ncbi:MAG TPA: sigma-70 family RNA polymerase sigma factor [Solirubrobacteraceae bacterium]|nr:sigma-70 family RNA polymerase sigma factor [Solirubrobacteraceae bacterium]